MNPELLKYLIFGFGLGTALFSFTFSDDLMNPNFYRRCLTAGIVSFILGLTFELTNSFNVPSGMTLLIMSAALLHLIPFELFRRLFKHYTGTNPYVTSASSSTGGTPIGGFWHKYPRNRKIQSSDFAFSFLQALVPIFTFMLLVFLIKN